MKKERFRIALVLNRFYPEVGGAETNLYFQAKELAKRHSLTVFTPRRLAETPKTEEMNGFRVFRLRDWKNVAGKFPNIRRDTLMIGVFFRILFGKFDVVQVFPALNHNNIMALLAAKIRRIPFILCSFDLLDYAEIERKTGKIDPNMLDRYRPGRIRRFLFSVCDHIFAISNREIAVYRRCCKSVSFSPVPILPDEYALKTPNVREKYGIPADAMVFLLLGRISKIKGQDIAVEAFVRTAGKMEKAVLAVVGRDDYEPELAAALHESIRKSGLEKRCFFTGMIAREEVIGFLQQSDIHVIPVRFMNSGAVVVESWAGGIPVIQSDAVDPNLVEPGVNGYLFKSEDVDGLGECMLKAWNERKKLPEMAENGRLKVMRDFTYSSLIAIYEKEYDRLINHVDAVKKN
ncbi:MAG: glycosyltransferase family 4 protein [Victivallaceae bacterium]|nr:glycosyltransferase family 4 protein [Victivallaceae bacterium]